MITRTARPTTILFHVGLCLAVAQIAQADDAGKSPQYPPANAQRVDRLVAYYDLDLQSKGDVKTLYRRLNAAARTVCDARRSYPPIYIAKVVGPCVRNAMTASITAVNSPLLTMYHQQKQGIQDGEQRELNASAAPSP